MPEEAPFVSNKDWLDFMMRDQFMRAAVENRPGVFLQPPESVENVAGNKRPEAFYREVAPKHMKRAAKATGAETGEKEVDVMGGQANEPNEDTAREMAINAVDDNGVNIDGEEFYDESAYYNSEIQRQMEQQDGPAWRRVEDEWERDGGIHNDVMRGYYSDVPESFQEYVSENDVRLRDTSDVEEAANDWEEADPDNRDAREVIDALEEPLIEARDVFFDDRLADEVQYDAEREFNNARDQQIEDETQYIMDNWGEYFSDEGDLEDITVKAMTGTFPPGAKERLQIEGTYLLSHPLIGAAAAGTAAGLLSRRKRRKPRGLLRRQ